MEIDHRWHSLKVEETFAALDTSEEGLTAQESEARLGEFGPNELARTDKTNILEILLHQVKNPLVAILVIAAVIAILAGKTIDAIVIGVVIVINTLIGFFQEYRAERALEVLRQRAAPEADVIRQQDTQSDPMTVRASQVVPGDIILLDSGDRVPADARIIEAVNLRIDESMLTGESVAVDKTSEPLEGDLVVADRKNLVFSGTIVTEGRGKAVVYATGERTQMGEIATLIEEAEKVQSPLQKQTAQLGKVMGILAIFFSGLILIAGLVRGFPLSELFLFVIAAAVSAIPEGLPAVMSITLAVGVNRMARRNAIIRRLPAVDTLGATTVICTDKTGTLTTNQLTVQRLVLEGRVIQLSGKGFTPQGEFTEDGETLNPNSDESLRKTLQIALLCNDASLRKKDGKGGQEWEIHGDPTEAALIVAAGKAGMVKDQVDDDFPRIDEIPFSSERKFMATFHRDSNGKALAYVKGAPEVVLQRCSHYLIEDELVVLDEEARKKVIETNDNMAQEALRVLAVAYREIDEDQLEKTKEKINQGEQILVFSGLLGMMDPPRPEAQEAVRRCKRAGIKVIMVTGDNKVTGEAIAEQVGILERGALTVTGGELETMSEEQLDDIIEETVVFARVSPAHKQRIVAALQRKGHVVAMTGDGVNDAPALKSAQIGVAMGITGTDVTKETAEMVLTDDNFASIVNAAEEGRVVFQNVRKVVKFLIATNAGEILTILVAIFLLPTGLLIFTPVQILWVNLVTDGLLDITIALEPKEGDVMDEPPRDPKTPILNREIFMIVAFVAVIMAAGTLFVYFYNLNPTTSQTLAFVTIALFQVFNSLNVRSRHRSVFQIGLFSNRYLVAAIIASVILLYLATTLSILQVALETVPLAAQEWGLAVLVASSIFILEEIRKIFTRRMKGMAV
jgi:P-type Ca2+ transporter type 2C